MSLDASGAADERRTRDLQQARAECSRAETDIAKLLELVETGLMSARDPVFAKRLSDHRVRIATLNTTIESLERQLQRGARRITPQTSSASAKHFAKSSPATIRLCARPMSK